MGIDDARAGGPRLGSAERAARLTPAERALRDAAGPTYFELGAIADPPESSVAAVEPDDWRLYHLMRNLPDADRARVLQFAELLYNVRHAMDWASPDGGDDIVTDIR